MTRLACAIGFLVFSSAVHEFAPPSWRATDPRGIVEIPREALGHSQANLWRYPPGTGGRRHREPLQEEVFCVIEGVLTAFLGEPPERFELPSRSVLVVQPGTPVQLRNDSDTSDVIVFAFGAPYQDASYKAEILEDA